VAEPRFDLEVRVRVGDRDLPLRLRTEAQRIAIVGPSGAGKSTLLRVFAGVQPGVVGRCLFAGQSWLDTARRRFVAPEHRQVGWVPQEALLFPHVDVRRNLLWGSPNEDRLSEIAARLDIEALLLRRPRHLSGGERQRVALGRALLARPRLLLLDEPFAPLDPALRTDVARTVLAECERDNVALILVVHDLDRVSPLVEATFTLTERGLVQTSPDSGFGGEA